MAQIFPRWTNKIPLMVGVGAPVVLCGVVFAVWYWFSPKFTDVGYMPTQPVPFSHKLHAGEMGLDCRYCHNTVETAAHAAIPPAQTCMNCHSLLDLGENQARVQPVIDAYEGKESLEWVRVHMLPEYAYFDHSVHVANGVGCSTCHGRVDQMERVAQDQPLSMAWCLDCHRQFTREGGDPSLVLRPVSEITNMAWHDNRPAEFADYDYMADPKRARHDLIPPEHCSGCHR